MQYLVSFSFLLFAQNLGAEEGATRKVESFVSESSEKFIGCVWSPSECRWSCAGYDYFRFEHRPDLCDLYDNSPWACYCEDEPND